MLRCRLLIPMLVATASLAGPPATLAATTTTPPPEPAAAAEDSCAASQPPPASSTTPAASSTPATPGKAASSATPSSATPAITLTADPQPSIVNFGANRDKEYVDVVVTATAALPPDITPQQITLNVPRRLTREGAKLPTASAPKPLVSAPQITPSRKRITFTICLLGTGMHAGHYTGLVSIEAPHDIGPVEIGLVANAQDCTLFLGVTTLLTLLVFGLLLWRSRMGNVAKAATDAAAGTRPSTDKVLAKHLPPNLTVGDIIVAVVSTAAAVAASYAVFADNPSWGDDGFRAIAGLVGTMFGAAGLRSVLASLSGK